MARKQQLTSHRHGLLRPTGAYVTLEQLLEQRFAARSLELDYQSRSRLGMAGPHISRIKGRGVDFEEFRAYQPGDDIRTIDWRVTARLGRPFVKVFREERERPVIIGVDQSRSMAFGSQVAFKSVTAAEAAAILCWTTVDVGDRVGGVVFSDTDRALIKPRRGKRSALRLLNTLADYNQRQLEPSPNGEDGGNNNLRSALEQIHRLTRPGSNIYLISDFLQLDTAGWQYLRQLARHNNVTCVFVYDALEENLPLPGVYSFTDGSRRHAVDTQPRRLRRDYHEAFRSRREMLEAELNKLKVPLITIRTDQVVLERLETWRHRTL